MKSAKRRTPLERSSRRCCARSEADCTASVKGFAKAGLRKNKTLYKHQLEQKPFLFFQTYKKIKKQNGFAVKVAKIFQRKGHSPPLLQNRCYLSFFLILLFCTSSPYSNAKPSQLECFHSLFSDKKLYVCLLSIQ